MPRKIDDMLKKDGRWPAPGWYLCRCVRAEVQKFKSKTEAIRLTWRTRDAEYQFSDDLFLTPRAIKRLCLVASRVLGYEGELPDDDGEAVLFLESMILDGAFEKDAWVEVVSEDETIFNSAGPDIGKKTVVRRSRVSFNGYRKIETDVHPDEAEIAKPMAKEPDVRSDGGRDADIPF